MLLPASGCSLAKLHAAAVLAVLPLPLVQCKHLPAAMLCSMQQRHWLHCCCRSCTVDTTGCSVASCAQQLRVLHLLLPLVH